MNIRRLLRPARIAQRLYQLWTNQAIIIDTRALTALQNEVDKAQETIKYLEIENTNYRKQQIISDAQLQDMRPPVFIFGPPRSGSTFLVEAMNTHEMIYITNELRVMSFANDLLRLFLKSNRIEWNLSSSHKEAFLQHFRWDLANSIKRFYLVRMPSPDAIWGDKHPHYSDPTTDPGALDTILELFPDAKFINIYRNPREQIRSVMAKGWKDFKHTTLAYRRIITMGKAYGRKVGKSRYLEIRYEDLCENGEQIANEICEFLGLPPSEKWLEYMRRQEKERTPYSDPITHTNEIGRRKHISFSEEENVYYEKILGELAKQLGYD